MKAPPLLTNECKKCGGNINFKEVTFVEIDIAMACIFCGKWVTDLKSPMIYYHPSRSCVTAHKRCVTLCPSCWTNDIKIRAICQVDPRPRARALSLGLMPDGYENIYTLRAKVYK